MYNSQKTVDSNILHNEQALTLAVKAPIVYSDDEAQSFVRGLQKLAGMDKDQRDRFKANPREELKKAAKEDGDIAAFAALTEKAMDVANSVFTGTTYANPSARGILQKALHTDGLKDEMVAGRIIDLGLRNAAAAFDLGWTQAFAIESAEDVERLKLVNYGVLVGMLEYTSFDDDLTFQNTGSVEFGELNPRYFMSAIRYSPRNMRFSVIEVNRILSEIRAEAVRMQTRLAYRVLFDNTGVPTQALSTKFSGGAFADGIYNARTSLNAARVTLIDSANGVESGAKRTRVNGSRQNFPANVNALLYTSHVHGELLRDIMHMNRGVDTINPTIYGNMSVIETVEAPVTGSWKTTKLEGTERDDYGFFEKVEEGAVASKKGVMMVLPGGYNTMAIFRQLALMSKNNELKESIELAAKMEANAVMGKNQRRQVMIG